MGKEAFIASRQEAGLLHLEKEGLHGGILDPSERLPHLEQGDPTLEGGAAVPESEELQGGGLGDLAGTALSSFPFSQGGGMKLQELRRLLEGEMGLLSLSPKASRLPGSDLPGFGEEGVSLIQKCLEIPWTLCRKIPSCHLRLPELLPGKERRREGAHGNGEMPIPPPSARAVASKEKV